MRDRRARGEGRPSQQRRPRRRSAAATETSRHGVRAGSPVAGSMRWCRRTPPRSQLRTVRLLVASPPPSSVIDPPPGRPTARGTAVAMSPPAEIQPRADERERVVDGLALDDAVQIEHDGLGAEEHASAKRERFEGRNAHRLDRVAVEGERGEIAVVAGGEQGATDGRGHETAGGASCAECQVEHRRELLGDERHAGGCGVDARELRVREEAGEAAVARIEELADRLDRHAGADGDLTAHRPERAHEPPLWTEGTRSTARSSRCRSRRRGVADVVLVRRRRRRRGSSARPG